MEHSRTKAKETREAELHLDFGSECQPEFENDDKCGWLGEWRSFLPRNGRLRLRAEDSRLPATRSDKRKAPSERARRKSYATIEALNAHRPIPTRRDAKSQLLHSRLENTTALLLLLLLHAVFNGVIVGYDTPETLLGNFLPDYRRPCFLVPSPRSTLRPNDFVHTSSARSTPLAARYPGNVGALVIAVGDSRASTTQKISTKRRETDGNKWTTNFYANSLFFPARTTQRFIFTV